MDVRAVWWLRVRALWCMSGLSSGSIRRWGWPNFALWFVELLLPLRHVCSNSQVNRIFVSGSECLHRNLPQLKLPAVTTVATNASYSAGTPFCPCVPSVHCLFTPAESRLSDDSIAIAFCATEKGQASERVP